MLIVMVVWGRIDIWNLGLLVLGVVGHGLEGVEELVDGGFLLRVSQVVHPARNDVKWTNEQAKESSKGACGRRVIADLQFLNFIPSSFHPPQPRFRFQARDP